MTNNEQQENKQVADNSDTTAIQIPVQQASPQLDTPTQQPFVNSKDLGEYRILSYKMRYDPVSIAFAFLLFVGGYIGYAKSDSVLSIVTASIFAVLILGATYYEAIKKSFVLLVLVTILLIAGMTHRFILTLKFFPAGFFALLSLILLIRYVYLWKARAGQKQN